MTMGYTASEREIAAHFRAGMTEGEIPGTGVTLSARRFRSFVDSSLPDGREVPGQFLSLFRSRELEESNREFSYYIMFPRGTNQKESAGGTGSGTAPVADRSTGPGLKETRGRGVIILLHGLNERSWSKYIQWATSLASGTGRPVVLFPLAYHMNRSPGSWMDRHIMIPLVNARTTLLPDTRFSTFVNVALSTRMTISPQRFMVSGYQTAVDLAALIQSIREGSIPGIAAGGPADIFAYSIGALVTQVMMLSDPSPLPDDSRIMLFCGGSTFGLMNGTSKLIMDSRAFEKLLSFYLNWPDVPMNGSRERLTRLMKDTPEGEAFFAMTSMQRLRDLRGRPFSRYDGRLKAVTLAGDTVIPCLAVRETLSGADTEIWEPGYPCTHESPFPLLAGDKADAVDRTFDRLFDTAAGFLS
jgi:pimeloyl-ACP methyl ester carboxylesterase